MFIISLIRVFVVIEKSVQYCEIKRCEFQHLFTTIVCENAAFEISSISKLHYSIHSKFQAFQAFLPEKDF